MALAELIYQHTGMDAQQALIAVTSLVLGVITAYLYVSRPLGGKSPKLVKGDWPIIGSLRFFTHRLDFCREAAAHSSTGNFSFHVGSHPVVGLTGDEGRTIFLENKHLSLNDGYNALFAGSPKPPKTTDEESHANDERFAKRILQLLRRENFVKGLPAIISDTRMRLDKLAEDSKGTTDPFDSVYRIVFQLTMRTVACGEIADNPALLEKTLYLFETLEANIRPEVILFPWFPSPAKLKRYWYGAQLYMIFQKIYDDRKKTGRRENDPMQFLMDKGDSVREIIAFVLGALFAGQLNSGINAAWVLLYLANDPEWMGKIREEVQTVAERYDSDTSKSLTERLASVPLEAWESEFPLVDLCLRDSIRIQAVGTAFRQNMSDKPIKVGNEEIPAGAYAAYPVADVHMDPNVYANPTQWDPSRYLPERAEDQKRKYAFIGWGAGRHPCLGIRFAKLEQNIIVAYFMAYFDFELSDESGRNKRELPEVNANGLSASKPKERVYLKYKLRA